jgi:zinc protease
MMPRSAGRALHGCAARPIEDKHIKIKECSMRIKTSALLLAVALGFPLPGLAAEGQAAAPATATSAAAPVKAVKFTKVEGITEYRLPNGLRVLLAPDASKPTATVNITYLVGSRHENYGETGMAHLLEHLVFKGTPARGNIMQELGKRGWPFNGTTFFDRTNYFETFPATDENLTWALEMEADRMVNSFIAKSDLEKEFSVVRNEMEMGENNPRMALWKQMTGTAFTWHNYGKSTIGARSDVENVRIENLQAFYRKYYQPDNAVLIVAGKIDEAKTIEKIERIFGAIPRPSRQILPTYTQEPVQDGAREVTVSRVGDTQLVAVLYKTPAGSHADSAALAALNEVLTSTPNGRLHKLLVEGKKAVGVEGWPFMLAEPGYIVFWVQLDKKQSIAEARKSLLAALENIAKQPITKAELKRAKASLLNDYDKTINDPQRLGVELSESIAMGDWRLFFIGRDAIEKLTAADLQRVALNYLKESNRTLGQFVPTDKPDRVVMPDTPDVAKLVEGYTGRTAVAEGEAFDPSPANIDARTQRLTLANGMKLALLPKKTRGETVQGQIHLDFGDEKTLNGQSTHANFVSAMLMRGAGKLSRADITARLDELKAKVSVSGGATGVTVRFETVKKNLPEVLDLIRDVLRNPTFPQAEFELARSETLAAIEAQRREPQAVAIQALRRAFNTYPKGDVRYVSSFDELVADTKAVKLADAKAFHARFYGAQAGEAALVGDFDAKAVEAQFKSLFGDWKAKTGYIRVPNPVQPAKPGVQQIETPDKANAFFIASLPLALQDTSPDYVPMLIAEEVLGGGTKSRLLDRLRQKEGISYYAGAQMAVSSYEPSGSTSLLAIYAPQNLGKLQAALQEEMARFVKDGITAEELADAKKGLLQQRKVLRAQDAALAGSLVSQLDLGRTMAFSAEIDAKIEAATLDQVNAAIRKHVDPAKFTWVYAGDFAGTAKKAAEASRQ